MTFSLTNCLSIVVCIDQYRQKSCIELCNPEVYFWNYIVVAKLLFTNKLMTIYIMI